MITNIQIVKEHGGGKCFDVLVTAKDAGKEYTFTVTYSKEELKSAQLKLKLIKAGADEQDVEDFESLVWGIGYDARADED